MKIEQLRQTLREFSRQSRAGGIVMRSTDAEEIARLAEQLETAIGRAVTQREIKSDTTISFGPSGCPCCGK